MRTSRGHRVALAALVFVAGALAAIVPATGPAGAATFVVTNGNDAGPGSLRQAILDAEANAEADTITFAGDFTITLASPLPTVTKDLTITGTGAGKTIVDGAGAHRPFQIDSGTVAISSLTIRNGGSLNLWQRAPSTLTLSEVTVTGGTGAGLAVAGSTTIRRSTISGNTSGPAGGGIDVRSSTFVLEDSTITGNSAATGGGLYKGSTGSFTIRRSTISGNTATGNQGGGGFFDGGVGAIVIEDSTISGNSAPAGPGGGLRAVTSTTTLRRSTISGNTAAGDGSAVASGVGGTVILDHTVLQGSGPVCHVGGGSITSSGHNIANDATCNLTATGDKPSTDPQLGALVSNGGPTQTHLPAATSPAIDGGAAACGGTLDQRSLPRPRDFNLDGVVRCDVGAVEQRLVPTLTSVTPSTVSENSTPSLTMTGSNVAPGAVVSFGSGVAITTLTRHSPTSVTAVVSVSGGIVTTAGGGGTADYRARPAILAQSGASVVRDVTVTNPDGESATCSRCLTILAQASTPTTTAPPGTPPPSAPPARPIEAIPTFAG